jgi:hypothetical protein
MELNLMIRMLRQIHARNMKYFQSSNHGFHVKWQSKVFNEDPNWERSV